MAKPDNQSPKSILADLIRFVYISYAHSFLPECIGIWYLALGIWYLFAFISSFENMRKSQSTSPSPESSLKKNVLQTASKIVLKLGTKVLLSHHHDMDSGRMQKLVEDIALFRRTGYTFSIVTSGAVGLGMNIMGLEKRPQDLKKIQALAAVGQNMLMQKWSAIFEKSNLRVGQILLTYDVIENRKRFLYARDCLNTLIDYGIVPIVNENDSVAVDELKFGDNDLLSALTAHLLDADLLVLFTDTDGLYDKNPHLSAAAKKISFLEEINDSSFQTIQDSRSDLSLGGMRSKLMAAQLAARSGVAVVIANGFSLDLKGILEGENTGTFIRPVEKSLKNKKKWIFFNQKIKGNIFVDRGAEEAVVHHLKSLLPGGVIRTEKQFGEGSVVGIFNQDNRLIGKGISYFSSQDIEKIKGRKTSDIKAVLGEGYYEEIIHRDNLIIL
jgi:glutamate 5-kinase